MPRVPSRMIPAKQPCSSLKSELSYPDPPPVSPADHADREAFVVSAAVAPRRAVHGFPAGNLGQQISRVVEGATSASLTSVDGNAGLSKCAKDMQGVFKRTFATDAADRSREWRGNVLGMRATYFVCVALLSTSQSESLTAVCKMVVRSGHLFVWVITIAATSGLGIIAAPGVLGPPTPEPPSPRSSTTLWQFDQSLPVLQHAPSCFDRFAGAHSPSPQHGRSRDEVAELLDVSTRTVKRIFDRHTATGTVENRDPMRPGLRRIIGPKEEDNVREALANRPDSYLDELIDASAVDVSVSTMSRALTRLGVTHKMVRFLNLKASFSVGGGVGASRQSSPAYHTPSVPSTGARAKKEKRNTSTTCSKRTACFPTRLFPLPQPLPRAQQHPHYGQLPNSLLPAVARFPSPNNFRIIYLPQYSPDLNPIEQASSKFKASLRRNGDHVRTDPDQKEVLVRVCKRIRAEDAIGYYADCGCLYE
ncbi:hypothetical protein BDK51DRAFT_43484 [Blyttiomyces helicus]|uniref:Tc1-like transposase DDE domain-containing protein n=1 Tax=Blyttiomyces helicus TaxID=388810 RepID=A0A4P9W267_9FUNG|nr:hypothetical protein BDK51DRAFT_43484 [Blyttiomyces helicus]|eukprot:RKO84680.1 hypothetical protein BDK51DRAFT_43484 [Blyttiomyces helicus]